MVEFTSATIWKKVKAMTSFETSIISSKLTVMLVELSLKLDSRVVVRVMSAQGFYWGSIGG